MIICYCILEIRFIYTFEEKKHNQISSELDVYVFANPDDYPEGRWYYKHFKTDSILDILSPHINVPDTDVINEWVDKEPPNYYFRYGDINES